MRKFIKYLPFLLWCVYFSFGFERSNELVSARLEGISLSREMTVGGFPKMLNIAAYSSFFDDVALLILSFVVYFLIKKKYSKQETTNNQN